MTDGGEHIDTRQWLPRGESIVTPQRAAKNDLAFSTETNPDGTERISHAESRPVTIMLWLYDRRVLNGQHLLDGQAYEAWQYWFLYHLWVKPNRLYSSREELRDALAEAGIEAKNDEDYEWLMRSLSHAQRKVLTFAVHNLAEEWPHFVRPTYLPVYAQAFERLSALMAEVRTRAKTRREQAL